MNHDGKDENANLNLWIDPEMEARVVAWVMGEVSDFEAAELERLMKEKPELALFRERIEAAHNLVGEAVRPDREALRLAAGRRAELLTRISASAEDSGAERPAAVYSPSKAIPWRRWLPAGAISVAASFVLVFGIIRMGLPDFEFGRAEFDRSVESPAPTPPPAEREGGRPYGELHLMAGDGGRSRSPSDGPLFQPLESNEFSFSLAPGSGGPSVSMDELDRQLGRDQREVAAAVDSSFSYKNEGVEGEEIFFDFNDPDRLDANKPAATGPSDSFFQGAGKAAPAASLREHARMNKADRPPLPDKGSKDEEGSGYRSNTVAVDSRLESRIAAEIQGPSKTLDEKKAFATVGGAKGKLDARDEFSKLRGVGTPVPEVNAIREPVSTFSLHVSDVSFRTALAALRRGEWPEPASIRPEEFYNAFDYGDPAPVRAEKISCRIEQVAHPYIQQRNLVRIAMKVPAIGRGAGQSLHLTVMVDTSGSMEREDRRASVESAIEVLATLLGSDDRVNLIGFARRARLLAEALPGDEAGRLAEILANTPSEGGTNLEEALNLSLQLARRHFDPSAQNRIVLITDGAANLGNADPEALSRTVEAIRQQGIAFDACGVGMDGLDDAVLEALTRKGDGRYYVLDSPEDADEGFADQLAGAFRPAAGNVKVQVRFNPARVGNYRLIGFEKHRLKEDDFRDDRVDAAELAAEEAAVALYQVEVLPEGEGDLGEVYVRFRDMATGQMVERSWTASFDPSVPAFERGSPAMQLAGTAALLAGILQGGSMAEQVQLDDLAPVVNRLRGHYANEARVQELVGMYDSLRRIQNTGAK